MKILPFLFGILALSCTIYYSSAAAIATPNGNATIRTERVRLELANDDEDDLIIFYEPGDDDIYEMGINAENDDDDSDVSRGLVYDYDNELGSAEIDHDEEADSYNNESEARGRRRRRKGRKGRKGRRRRKGRKYRRKVRRYRG